MEYVQLSDQVEFDLTGHSGHAEIKMGHGFVIGGGHATIRGNISGRFEMVHVPTTDGTLTLYLSDCRRYGVGQPVAIIQHDPTENYFRITWIKRIRGLKFVATYTYKEPTHPELHTIADGVFRVETKDALRALANRYGWRREHDGPGWNEYLDDDWVEEAFPLLVTVLNSSVTRRTAYRDQDYQITHSSKVQIPCWSKTPWKEKKI